jgi:hypothetical protein
VIAMILVACGILLAAGLTFLAIREREWGLALFMGLITLVSIAAGYVAFDCFGNGCLFRDEPSSFFERQPPPETGDA